MSCEVCTVSVSLLNSVKAAVDNREMNERGCVPIKLYLQQDKADGERKGGLAVRQSLFYVSAKVTTM